MSARSTQPGLSGLLVVIAVGGALGSLGRYGLGRALPHGPESIPVSTLLVNIVGSLLLGVIVSARPHDPWLRPFLGTGVLGGFTTFSAFALETDRLLETSPAVGLVYVGLTVAGGLGAAALGTHLGGRGMPRAAEVPP